MTSLATQLDAWITEARESLGGRYTCCQHGPCATHLAEDHPAGRRADRVLHMPHSIAEFPETPGQELTQGAVIAAMLIGRRVLGIEDVA